MQCSCISWSTNLKLGPSISKSKVPIAQAEAVAADIASTAGRISLPSHVKAITSTSNPFVKHCVKLRFSSSYRHFHGSVLVVGATPIREICKFQESLHGTTSALECLLLLDEVEVPEGLVDICGSIVRVSPTVMKKLSGMQSTESIDAIALMRLPASFCSVDHNEKEAYFERWFPSPHRILVLEGIQFIAGPGQSWYINQVCFGLQMEWCFSASWVLRSIQREGPPSQSRSMFPASNSLWHLESS